MEQHIYTSAEIKNEDEIIVRRCVRCGEMVRYSEDRAHGALPLYCRVHHGNQSIEILVDVPSSPREFRKYSK